MTLAGVRDRILVGDVRDRIRDVPDGSAHAVVTSPPYWGLRDYGEDRQIGHEATLEHYVAVMVEVFREVRRVLRRDGTLWLVMGDSYGSPRSGPVGTSTVLDHGRANTEAFRQGAAMARGKATERWPRKQLIGQPWRMAFALQADGWALRTDVIHAKPNPMPESVRDRPTRAHDYVFLFATGGTRCRYFYDRVAMSEVAVKSFSRPETTKVAEAGGGVRNNTSFADGTRGTVERRNKRTVWTIAHEGFTGTHYATMPVDLAAECIAASTSQRGACVTCGAQMHRSGSEDAGVTWRQGCECDAADPAPSVVFDPFIGAGTVALAAARAGRSFVGIEISEEYAGMARTRLEGQMPLVFGGGREVLA